MFGRKCLIKVLFSFFLKLVDSLIWHSFRDQRVFVEQQQVLCLPPGVCENPQACIDQGCFRLQIAKVASERKKQVRIDRGFLRLAIAKAENQTNTPATPF